MCPPQQVAVLAKSPREDGPPASADSPTLEREKSATPTNEHPASENPYAWLNMINMDMAQQRFRYRSTLTADR
jgi:hypothetical protein